MPPKAHKPPGEKNDTEGERIYQDHFGDFFLRVIWRFISHLETILKTIFSENNCQIENSLQNSLQAESKP